MLLIALSLAAAGMAAGSADNAAACIADANARTGLEWVTWITGLTLAIVAGIGAIATALLLAFAKVLAGFRELRRQMQAGVNQVKADVSSFSTQVTAAKETAKATAVEVAGHLEDSVNRVLDNSSLPTTEAQLKAFGEQIAAATVDRLKSAQPPR